MKGASYVLTIKFKNMKAIVFLFFIALTYSATAQTIERLVEAEIVIVTDLPGRTIKTVQTDKIMPVEDLMRGVYFIHSRHLATIKIIKQ